MNYINTVQTISCFLFCDRSIKNKFFDLEHELLLLDLLPSIIFATETWPNSDYFISGTVTNQQSIKFYVDIEMAMVMVL